MYISHQMQKKTVSLHSISGNVILSFKHFQQNYGEAVSVNVFTAISPPKLMHEDICTLALDEIACFLVLPFHKKWLVDGSIETEDPTLRTLNCCVSLREHRALLGSSLTVGIRWSPFSGIHREGHPFSPLWYSSEETMIEKLSCLLQLWSDSRSAKADRRRSWRVEDWRVMF